MAPIDRRARLLGWALRRVASVASMTVDDLVAMQSRAAGLHFVTDRLCGAIVPGVEFEDRTIPGPAGAIAVRVYRAHEVRTSGPPLIVNFHGGGFVFGDLRTADWLCSSVVAATGAIVVSVDYRLAPAHPFPAAVEDCYASVEWAAEHTETLGASGPIGVMGESAGGNLSAVTCLLAWDRGGPAISHQALLYPVTNMTMTGRPPFSSVAMNADAPILSHSEMFFYRRHYLGAADPADPRVSPLLAEDHSGLPPALIQVAEHDPLRDDGIRYAVALREAGVAARLTEYVGMPHGYLNFPGVCRAAPQALAELCAEQQAALAPPVRDPGLTVNPRSRPGAGAAP
ncbi:MAG: alpha/beta hydrolase fold domain-containing protein [Streptosporangiales bacterium]|nr:alpha/beta hydrolase fold domain-containing protein [Streptosporangiales bacterium]